MKLLIQPGDGANSLVKAIHGAKHSIEIAIFRFDQREIEKALTHAVGRGVSVRALIAHTNRAGEDNLRRLELRLLGAGVTVARTADDLPRYHGKFMIVDRRELHLLAFNLTYQDIEHCRSFGVVTRSQKLVREAGRLFDADSKRIPYEPALDNLVVSPVNARRRLDCFIRGARKELLIYDPKVSDEGMFGLLEERARAGVEIRIIGKVTRPSSRLEVRKLRPLRLHTRTMIRDGKVAFIGSQSLRGIELDMRREVGIIFRDPKVVSQLVHTFHGDWLGIEQNKDATERKSAPVEKLAKEVVKAVAKELPAVAPVVDTVVKELVSEAGSLDLNRESVEETVNEAVKEAVKEAIKDAVEQAVEQHNGGN
ncbi:MAG TPA: phospholipase D-like domain-containing protein [Bryobacteraceae bacterium]|nr:phospholipase D-like domain-containing protein [Bryobacteraceae bacterium]